MKYRRCLFIIIILFLSATVLFAQTSLFNHRTEHYSIESDASKQQAELFGRQLEALFNFYNRYFRFDENQIEDLLQVRLFETRARYESYLGAFLETIPEGNFIYLHYNNPLRNTLVGYQGSLTRDPEKSMVRQAFMQFLRTFVNNPPVWLRGFTLYFEDIQFEDDFQSVILRENLAWAEKLQSILEQDPDVMPISIDRFLSMDLSDARETSEVFYPMAWGMISFLLNTDNPMYSRLLWDSISNLKKNNTLRQNIDAINQYVFAWDDLQELSTAYRTYIEGQKSFRTLITLGKELYEAEGFEEAELMFISAIEARPESYIPYYYRGLINYRQGKFGLSRAFYEAALERGISKNLAYYALGILEYSQSNFEEAKEYLLVAAEPGSEYRSKAEGLIGKINDFIR